MSTHSIRAEIEAKFRFPGLADGEFEVAYPTLEIEYDYAPGRPAYTPRGEYAPIDPPDPAEVAFRSATLIDGDGLTPDQKQIDEWAIDYLDSDHGYNRACQEAAADSGPDRTHADR